MDISSGSDGALVVEWILVKEVWIGGSEEWICSIKKGRFFMAIYWLARQIRITFYVTVNLVNSTFTSFDQFLIQLIQSLFILSNDKFMK